MDVDHAQARDGDAAQHDALKIGVQAQTGDPVHEKVRGVLAVDREAGRHDGLDPVRPLHEHADDRHRLALPLLEGSVVDP